MYNLKAIFGNTQRCPVADLGEGSAPPVFWQKKNEKMQKEEKPAGQAISANRFCFNISKKTAPTPLVQGLDPPLRA